MDLGNTNDSNLFVLNEMNKTNYSHSQPFIGTFLIYLLFLNVLKTKFKLPVKEIQLMLLSSSDNMLLYLIFILRVFVLRL